MYRRILSPLCGLLLAGCAQSSAIQTSANSLQVTTSAAPICGATGAQKVAYQRAAIETINHGYDRFIITGAAAQNSVHTAGYTPVYANTTGTLYGSTYGNTFRGTGFATTTYSGGYPIIAGTHDQAFSIQMFHDGDAGAESAISARDTLGPDWQTLIQRPPATC
jgi:hypothetical protein